MNRPTHSAALVVIATLLILAEHSAPAHIYIKCPANANDNAVGVAFAVFVNRGGVLERVNGQFVGAHETLILKSAVYYAAFGLSGGVGAGFTGGTAQIILPNGAMTNVTPADMETTLVTTIQPDPNACTPPVGMAATPVKPMFTAFYTFTDEDIANGLAQFRFEYTNALSLLPNVQGECIDRQYISLTESVLIEPQLALSLHKGSHAVLTVRGPTKKHYRIESSDSLDTTNWTTCTNFLLHTNPFVWRDDSPAPSQRFYRAKVVP